MLFSEHCHVWGSKCSFNLLSVSSNIVTTWKSGFQVAWCIAVHSNNFLYDMKANWNKKNIFCSKTKRWFFGGDLSCFRGTATYSYSIRTFIGSAPPFWDQNQSSCHRHRGHNGHRHNNYYHIHLIFSLLCSNIGCLTSLLTGVNSVAGVVFLNLHWLGKACNDDFDYGDLIVLKRWWIGKFEKKK